MGQFETRTIEEVTDVLIDYRGKTPPKTKSGVKLITAKVIKDGSIIDGNHEYISGNYYDAWMRRGLPQQWDILITTEAPLGEVAQLRTPERVALAQRVILLRGKSELIDQNYYYQALKSPFAQKELQSRASGATVAGIRQTELLKVKIPYYPLPIQKRISSILSAYDDLIENNTRRIQILEGMARGIYREWFIEKRFPNHAAYANEALPEGWQEKKLGEIAEEQRRTIQPKQVDENTPYIGLEHMPRRSIALAEWGTASDVSSTKMQFARGEILFGKIRPYFHKVGVAPVDGICSSDIIVIAPIAPEYFAVTLACVSSDEFVQHATQTSQGTKMPRANWELLTKYPIFVPPSSLFEKFNQTIMDIVSQIQNLVMRNRNLRRTRDLLLPKLVSGEMDVSQIEIDAETTEP